MSSNKGAGRRGIVLGTIKDGPGSEIPHSRLTNKQHSTELHCELRSLVLHPCQMNITFFEEIPNIPYLLYSTIHPRRPDRPTSLTCLLYSTIHPRRPDRRPGSLASTQVTITTKQFSKNRLLAPSHRPSQKKSLASSLCSSISLHRASSASQIEAGPIFFRYPEQRCL